MSKAQDFFTTHIAEAVSKALGLPVSNVVIDGTGLVVNFQIVGDGANTLFWQAVLEQQEKQEK